MPGLCGFFLRRDRGDGNPQTRLEHMLSRARYRHPLRQSGYADARFAAQNARFADRFIRPGAGGDKDALFFDGYLLNRSEVLDQLRSLGVVADGAWDDETLVRLLYAERGGELVEDLQGSFNICAYHADRAQVLLLNCRHGARHLYYRLADGYLAFATQLRCLTAVEKTTPQSNRLALMDLFNFGYISGAQTLFEGIDLLPPGTVLEVGAQESRLRKYWDFPYQNTGPAPTYEEMVEEGAVRLERAVGRCLQRFGPVGIPLSGGLDSRAILAFASKKQPSLDTFHCAWYAREERIAQQLCQAAQARWNGRDPLRFDYGEILREGMEISDGQVHCHQFWFLPVAREIGAAQRLEALLDGYLLDVFFGDTFLVLPTRERYTDEEKRSIINGIWRRCRPIFVKRAFLPAFYREYEQANRASIEAQMRYVDEEHLSNFVQRFSLANRSNRYSVALPNVQRHFVEYAFPGLDYELTDFYLRLPPAYKAGARFYRSVLLHRAPAFARVPWAKTGRPLDQDKGPLTKAAEKLALRQLGSLALLRLSGGRLDWSHRADLNRHFRRNPSFRSAFTEVLEDPRTHGRGIIDREGVRRLIGFVDRGWPVLALLQSLVTVELWHRKFADG